MEQKKKKIREQTEAPVIAAEIMEMLGREDKGKVPEVLPVLPLNDFVLFPNMITPLVVQTERSKKLIEDITGGAQYFIGCLQKVDKPDDKITKADIHRFGCIGHILKMLNFPDGSVHILVEGLSRCAILEFEPSPNYLLARYEMIEDAEEDSVELKAMTRNASHRFQEVITMTPTIPDELKVAVFNTSEPGRLSDLIAANLNVSAELQQDLLAERNVLERFSRLSELLNKEYEVLKLGSKIQQEVSETFSKTQREYFLREQLKAIRAELGEKDQQQAELGEIEQKLETAGLSEEALKVAKKEKNRLAAIPSASPEYGVIRTYLDWLTELPWKNLTQDHLEIIEAARILDEGHYGLKKVKERIVEYLAVLKLKNDLKGPILCLVGPPGVGKTSLGKSVAEAMGREFIRMSLGGLHDEAEIRGHRRTYIGAMPGRIIQSIKRAGTRNPVIMLDEIDKIGADFRGDPSDALLEVLDPEQNGTFRDNYLDVDFDLSKVLFITTANVLDTIPEPLLDRMEIIEISSYTTLEKMQIAKRYLIPKQIGEHGLPKSAVKFADTGLEKIIENYTAEAGVRNLEREIAHCCRKVARKYAEGNRRPVQITERKVREFLGPIKIEQDVAEQKVGAGVVTGMAWTPVGGDILFVEATQMPGEGQLILTGSLGDVMKESARAALSYIRTHGERFNAVEDPEHKYDIHIHVPEGAIPKDGPSAGFAMTLALVSMFTNRPIRPDLAMTGEITLRGKITPIGGLKEKVLAAARAGIKHIIIPIKNKKDLIDIPKEVQDKITFKCVSNIDDALRYAFKISEEFHSKAASVKKTAASKKTSAKKK
jgi:ATP-dependent Lon protease